MKNLSLYIIYCFPLFTLGQNLSIQELWKNAEKSLKNQQKIIQTRIKKQELEEIRSDRIPIFYIDANLQRNLIIPTTPVPAIAFDPSAQDGAIIPLKFSTKWSSKAGIQVEWKIFDPKRNAEIEQKMLEVEKADIEKEQTLQKWKKDATQAYASVVLATEQYQSTIEDSLAYAEIWKVTQERYQAGRETMLNLNNALQQVERNKIQLYQAWQILKEADIELQNYIDVDTIKYLDSDLETIYHFLKPYDDVNYKLKSLEIDQRISTIQLAAVKKQLLPTLTFNGYLGEQYYSNELRLTRKEEWYGNSFINVAVRIPISQYFTAQPTLRKINLNAQLVNKQIEENLQNNASDINIKNIRIKASETKLESYKNIEKLAQQQMQLQKEIYLGGRILITEYNQTLLNYQKARQDTWQAQFDLLKTLIE